MTASALSDDELAGAFADGAPQAFGEAYRRYAPLLNAVARAAGGDVEDARDCVHEALARVWSGGSYRPARGSLRAFLMVCVRNEALARRRAAARHAAVEQHEARLAAILEPPPSAGDHVQSRRLRAALAELPDEQRAVIELAYFGNRTQIQIAALLNLPLGTVKSRAALALRRLARTIGPDNA